MFPAIHLNLMTTASIYSENYTVFSTLSLGTTIVKLAPDTFTICKRSSGPFTHGGYKYKKEKSRGSRSYLRCLGSAPYNCKARLVVVRNNNEEEITIFNQHNHPIIQGEDKVSSKLLHKGFLFYKHYTKGAKTYWRCSKINSHHCPARLFTEPHGVTELNAHNHVY